MSNWSRRDVLKLGVAAPVAAGALASDLSAGQENRPQTPSPANATNQPAAQAAPAAARERLLMDFGWHFHLGDANDEKADFNFGVASAFAKSGRLFAASRPDFDDHDWREIDLPHDWAVELPFVNDSELVYHGSKPLGRAYPATSIGWYRKIFTVPASDLGRKLSIEFDGAYRDAMVALNGHLLGREMSGYAPFRFDVTDFVNYGGNNVLVARVDATENEGWFYEGAGIYRHVWLEKTDALHVAHCGTYVTSEVSRGTGVATLTIATEVQNDSDTMQTCQIMSLIVDETGTEVGMGRSAPTDVPPWSTVEVKQQVRVPDAKLWHFEEPHLYRLRTTIEREGSAADQKHTTFGIRTFRFDPDTGLYLNGGQVKVKGMCNHQDHAGVGSALPDRLQEFRIRRLKEMGVNAYRTSHNPPTPELLDACDRLGMLVLDETRMMSSDTEGLSQLRRMIRRDRNHPCIFMWSLGNEEPEQGTDRGERISRTMKRLAKRLDPSRPVTIAMNGQWGKGVSHVVDVQGFNYMSAGSIDQFHAAFPKQPSIGTEEASTLSTRGIYEDDKERGYVSAYDLNAPRWGATAEAWWKYYVDRPEVAGAFVWTGFDYRGEPTPYAWPCISSHFGVLDTCGFPKDNFYYYQAWWKDKPALHVLPHWNWAGSEGKEISVWVYSNCEAVELFLNDVSLGRKPMPRNSHLEWSVKYAPGVLLARGYGGTKVLAEARNETTGAVAAVHLSADAPKINADGEDVSVVTISVVDAQGRVVPTAGNSVQLSIDGPGKIIGVGNGDPSCHEADKAATRSVFGGLGQAIVQGTKQPGEIVLTAQADGLTTGRVTIASTAATPRASV
ncbi:MAG: beta-galactosidase GalA [Candidatus Acidiferrales bacterium]